VIKRSVLLRQGLPAGLMAGMAACRRRQPVRSAVQPVEFPLGGAWRVATATGFYPFVQQPQPNRFEGFDVDLMTAMAAIVGVTLTWQKLPFGSLIATVQSGQADVAIGAIAITPERLARVSFSQPYFASGVAIATAINQQGLDSRRRLIGKRLAVQPGTPGAELAIDIKGSTIQVYTSSFSALQAVADGQADAALCDLPLILGAIASDQIPNLKLSSQRLTTESFGIAVNPQRPHLLAAINQALATLKANGRYAELYRQWFGRAPQ
jgi:arginine/lysine/histidine/glutamine transport system substrate-binding/permease protein